MSTKNVETVRAAHEAFNARDFDTMVEPFAKEIVYTDEARGTTVKTPGEFKDWVGEWVKAFPDLQLTEARYLDAGDAVVTELIARGTNSGPLGPLPATGRRISMPVCEIIRFDESGRAVGGTNYYDQMTLLTQLGHAEAPPA